MKKLFFSLIFVLIGTMGMQAQDDLVATLNHGSTITTYSGEDALSKAYEAAANGDVITLSPGVFVGVDMNKAITLRGAGYKPMASNGYMSTQITGSMTVTVNSEVSYTFEAEGLDFLGSVLFYGDKLAPVKLSKCNFRDYVEGRGISMKAMSCIFGALTASNCSYPNYFNTTLYCYNCVIRRADSSGLGGNKIGKIVAYNCIVRIEGGGTRLHYSVLINSIIITDDNRSSLDVNCSADHCIGIKGYHDADLFENIANPSNVMLAGTNKSEYANVFKTLRDITSASIYETYELTDAAAAQYLGDDGTQVGIYGGNNPFNLEPTNPQVTKFSVSSTNENGQLKVKINVE